jgi:hypothetical protein
VKTYYMRHAADEPHVPHPVYSGMSKCGLDLAGVQPVTDLQVLVYLRGRSCGGCTPLLGRPEPHQYRKEAA